MRTAIPIAAAAGSLAVLVALVLQISGRPLATNDLWWHLAMGKVYANQGLWLDGDPILHTARGAPEPVAWLFALALHGLERGVGYPGLRVAHALAAALIAWLAFSLFRRESASPVATCLATGTFLVLAWPRLFQLRPDLVSIFATLLFYRLLLERAEPPSGRRIAAASVLLAVWANVHPVFMLGPFLVIAALLGIAARALLLRWRLPGESLTGEAARARRLGVALVLGLLAALANPRGARQHLAFATSAGEGTIWQVRDEWTHFDPTRWEPGRYGVAVSPFEWLVADATLALFAAALLLAALHFWRRPSRESLGVFDPVLLGLAVASVLASGIAVRFLWLAVFPLLFLLRCQAALLAARPALAAPMAWIFATTSVLLALTLPASAGFASVASSLPRSRVDYFATPYAANKFHERGVRFLEETELEGRLFNKYGMGGFLGYRLAPRLRVFHDGRMNVGADVFEDYRSVNAQRGARPGETFLDVLDRRGVDVFFGVGTPRAGLDDDRVYTTVHLERSPGWLLVARGPRYSLYLRDDPRNAWNLRRVAAYYAREGVPFDPAAGLDVSRLIRERPDWALAQGMLPPGYDLALAARASSESDERFRAFDFLGRAYVLIGAYPEQIAADRQASELRPEAVEPRRRLVVGLLRLDRPVEAMAAAEGLLRSTRDPHAALFRRVANEYQERSRALAAAPGPARLSLPLDAPLNSLPLLAVDAGAAR